MTINPDNRGKLLLLFFMGGIMGFLKKSSIISEGISYVYLGIIFGFLIEPFRKGVKLLLLESNNQEIILDASEEQNKIFDHYEKSIFTLPKWSNIYNNGTIIMAIKFLFTIIGLFLFGYFSNQNY